MTEIPEMSYRANNSTRVMNGSWKVDGAGATRVTLAFMEREYFRYREALDKGEQILLSYPMARDGWMDFDGEMTTFLSKRNSTPQELKVTKNGEDTIYELTLLLHD